MSVNTCMCACIFDINIQCTCICTIVHVMLLVYVHVHVHCTCTCTMYIFAFTLPYTSYISLSPLSSPLSFSLSFPPSLSLSLFFSLYFSPLSLPLSLFLHVLKGLDLHRPIVYQHSKKLLCSLTVLLACRDDYRAACEARLTQHEAFLHSPSLLSLTSNEGGGGGDLQRVGSLNSLNEGKEGISETSLARKARTLIKYISERYSTCTCIYMYFTFTCAQNNFDHLHVH